VEIRHNIALSIATQQLDTRKELAYVVGMDRYLQN